MILFARLIFVSQRYYIGIPHDVRFGATRQTRLMFPSLGNPVISPT
ncbi:hypothetical protein ALC57_02457 [Trachymyrmex cornetzi]|uniref:Uncharacterized protein n=1 Tax=Trachymyrmex cornetzi TaxID=471704 RepID=A0A151JPB8_9HYME|nr:hypothetical protein ALC57_02457 [Trachymyrmex cornetzi]